MKTASTNPITFGKLSSFDYPKLSHQLPSSILCVKCRSVGDPRLVWYHLGSTYVATGNFDIDKIDTHGKVLTSYFSELSGCPAGIVTEGNDMFVLNTGYPGSVHVFDTTAGKRTAKWDTEYPIRNPAGKILAIVNKELIIVNKKEASIYR